MELQGLHVHVEGAMLASYSWSCLTVQSVQMRTRGARCNSSWGYEPYCCMIFVPVVSLEFGITPQLESDQRGRPVGATHHSHGMAGKCNLLYKKHLGRDSHAYRSP